MTWNAILKNTVKSDAQEKSLPVGIFYTEKEEKGKIGKRGKRGKQEKEEKEEKQD